MFTNRPPPAPRLIVSLKGPESHFDVPSAALSGMRPHSLGVNIKRISPENEVPLTPKRTRREGGEDTRWVGEGGGEGAHGNDNRGWGGGGSVGLS